MLTKVVRYASVIKKVMKTYHAIQTLYTIVHLQHFKRSALGKLVAFKKCEVCTWKTKDTSHVQEFTIHVDYLL